MELKLILESILFSAQKPLSPKELRDVAGPGGPAGEPRGGRRMEWAQGIQAERRPGRTRGRSSGGSSQLCAELRGRFLAVRGQTGLRALDQGVGGPEAQTSATVPTRAGNAGHHRLSPADHPRGGGAGSRGERGRRDADAAGTGAGGAGGARRSGGTPDELRHHRAVPRVFRPGEPRRVARRR